MIIVSYEYYKNSYSGTLDESSFGKLIKQAVKVMKNRTNNRVVSVTEDSRPELVEDIKLCECYLVDELQSLALTNNSIVKSESSGKVSVSYSTKSSEVTASQRLSNIVETWLSEYGFTCMIWV